MKCATSLPIPCSISVALNLLIDNSILSIV
jgi:hypothetical protein